MPFKPISFATASGRMTIDPSLPERQQHVRVTTNQMMHPALRLFPGELARVPEAAMQSLIEALELLLPDSAVETLPDDGVGFTLPDGSSLLAWPDDVLCFRDAEGNHEKVFLVEEWTNDPAAVMREIVGQLARHAGEPVAA